MAKMSKEEKELTEFQRDILRQAMEKVGSRIKLAYSLSLALDILITDIDESLTFRDSRGMPLRIGFEREQKQHFKNFISHLKSADAEYERTIAPSLEASAEGDYSKFEGYRQDGNELIRIMMLYIDRTLTVEKVRQVVEYLEGMPEGGLFPPEIIQRFAFVAKSRK